MRILIECTFVYDFPKMNSGIQRVVRNIIRQLTDMEELPECIPIIFKDGHIYRVLNLGEEHPDILLTMKRWLEKKRHQFWMLYYRIEKKITVLNRLPSLRSMFFFAARVLALPFPISINLLRFVHPQSVDPRRAAPFQYQPSDTLLLLDSSWQSDFFAAAERMKQDGVTIVSVIYDLIPVTHPQFCEAGLVKVFLKWIEWIAQTADGFIAISQTIVQQAREQVIGQIGEPASNSRWYDYFYLGSELDLTHQSKGIRAKVIESFRDSTSVYLMVSTIEPRKNHHYLIDAFELLWHSGLDVKLCFVGKVGWKCADLVKRIESHDQLNKKFFVFNDLSDAELEYCYKNSRALVFPSFVEGFGLPIVEAMQRGLPVMASDIPVFREVCGEFAAYFDLDAPAALAKLIMTFESVGEFPALRAIDEWRWIDWSGAARMLIDKILAHRNAQPSNPHELPTDVASRANYI